jgi:hypothetical protein
MMLVNSRTAKSCCKDCDSNYGHSDNSKAKNQLKRAVRRREKRNWKADQN